MGRVIGRKADRHAVTRNHANSEAAHSAGQLSSHLLAVFESNLIAATAENFVDATGRLNQVISRQIRSILPTLDRVRTSLPAPDPRLAFTSLITIEDSQVCAPIMTHHASPVAEVGAG